MAKNFSNINAIRLFSKNQRDINRLPKLYTALMTLHMQQCPDSRFGQLILNIITSAECSVDDLFFMEDEKMLKLIEDYFSNLRRLESYGEDT